MGIQINGQTDTVTSTTAGGSVTVTPLAASGGLNVGTGASISSPATNVLTLGTNNSERVRINSSGAVGLGTANPQERLHNSITANNQNYLRLDNPSGTSYYGLNSSGDTEINAATNNNIIFKTFGTERSRIDSSGNLGIGTNNPTKALHISQNSDVAIRMHSGNSNTNARSWEIVVGGNASNNAEMVFRTRNDAGTGGSEAARFTASGNLAFPSGQGIDFSATANSSGTMTSELLSDYEEGTWTPSISGSTSGSINSGTQVGTYTRVGRIVTARFTFINPNATTIGGTWRLTGLPFAIRQSSNEYIGGFVHYNRGINTAGNWLGLFQEASNSQTYFRVMAHYMNGTESYDISGNVPSSMLFAGTVFYEAA